MILRTRWVALGLVASVGVACSDIASPLRSDFYEWRLIEPSPSGTGQDTISFHWDQKQLPVRVWVEDALGLPGHLRRAIDVWKSQFLYHEFDGSIVSDSAAADVIVRASSVPPATASSASATRLHRLLAPECSGETDLQISDDHTQLVLPVHIFLNPLTDPTSPGVSDCLALTSIHELGHALGIFRHSANPADIMFVNPVVALPSERDRNTAEVIYHLPSTLEAVHP